jgi:DNA-directed RNA polymerase subunit M/transcription elongation factor TFIIS
MEDEQYYTDDESVGGGEDDMIINVHEDDEEIEVKETYNYAIRASHPYNNKGIREKIACDLGKKFKSEKNGTILEKHLYNASISLAEMKDIPLKSTDPEFQLVYASLAYETLASEGLGIKDIIENLKKGCIEWKAPQFKELLKDRAAEEADHTQDVSEGIHECNDCKKNGKVYNKTRSQQIQTRGGDEGMTVFVTCVMCRKMWKMYN